MSKIRRNEAQTRLDLIDPALRSVGWGIVEGSYIRVEFPITKGRLIGGNKRGKTLSADYVLEYKNRRIGVVEAKPEADYYTNGVGQAKDYAERLHIRFTYSTNGLQIYEMDMQEGLEGDVKQFPSPDELWEMCYPTPKQEYKIEIENWKERLFAVPFEDKGGNWQPRYYQQNAIAKVLEAIAEKKDRILLTLVTGTGKTAIAFQIAWKLFYSKWNLQRDAKRSPRILFLADRNILADQAFNSFTAFDEHALVRITPKDIRKKGKVPTNGSIFFTIFQTFMSGSSVVSASSTTLLNSSTTSLSSSTNPKIEDKLLEPAELKARKKKFLTTDSASEVVSASSTTLLNSSTTESVEAKMIDKVIEPVEITEVTNIKEAKGYMYILLCGDESFYTGSTIDLKRRLWQHQNGEGANHTQKYQPVKLVYYETFDRIDIAFKREKQIQKWSRAKKIALINNDIEELKRLAKSSIVISASSITESPITENSITESSTANMKEATSKNTSEFTKNSIKKVVEFTETTDTNKVIEPAEMTYFGEYPKDFFDFIIIDECHRGGANDESTWRSILDYFSPAVQLGLTATPKRDVNTDTYNYFGEPVYSYKLKEGINDGFLTPFKVKEIDTTIDEYIYTNDDEVEGEIEEGREYKEEDFNRIIEIKAREEYRVKLFMSLINQNQKTLVFCATQVHAAAIRDLINQYATSKNPNYCHRVTADDKEIGNQHLREFQDNEKNIPTILTTSRKLSTGVDAPEIRNIVLMRTVKSMVEFKQIIGRGTRLFEGKDYFTIFDFVKAHSHFQDPEWDGEPLELEPVVVGGKKGKICKVCNENPCICQIAEPELCQICTNAPCVCEIPKKKMIKLILSNNKVREIDSMIKTSFWSLTGKPISSQEFMRQLFDDLPSLFENEEALRKLWSLPSTRKKLLSELNDKGYTIEQLEELRNLVQGKESDLFDVLSFVAYHKNLIPRLERATRAKVQLNDYNPKQQDFLNFVLEQYVREGVDELDDSKLPNLLELKYKAITDAKRELGDIKSIRETFIGFQEHLYQERAV